MPSKSKWSSRFVSFTLSLFCVLNRFDFDRCFWRFVDFFLCCESRRKTMLLSRMWKMEMKTMMLMTTTTMRTSMVYNILLLFFSIWFLFLKSDLEIFMESIFWICDWICYIIAADAMCFIRLCGFYLCYVSHFYGVMILGF